MKKQITNLMVNTFKILEIGIDFMGYCIEEESSLSYHHLLVPKRKGGKDTIENGAVLVRDTSHDYLHIIEKKDKKYYNFITQEMINENKKGFIDMENIKRIDEILLEFEYKHNQDSLKHGKLLLHDKYLRRYMREIDKEE